MDIVRRKGSCVIRRPHHLHLADKAQRTILPCLGYVLAIFQRGEASDNYPNRVFTARCRLIISAGEVLIFRQHGKPRLFVLRFSTPSKPSRWQPQTWHGFGRTISQPTMLLKAQNAAILYFRILASSQPYLGIQFCLPESCGSADVWCLCLAPLVNKSAWRSSLRLSNLASHEETGSLRGAHEGEIETKVPCPSL